MQFLEKIQPVYTVYYYTDFLYRVIKHKKSVGFSLASNKDSDDLPLDKFAQSYCRARSMVLQYSLCNSWDYFITITVNPDFFDRYELDPIARALKQWFLDYGKKFDTHIDFVLVPEFHKDRAWHFHGLIRGIPFRDLCVFPDDPYRPSLKDLHDKGYLNWPSLMRKIGFCSLAPISNPVGVGFYVTKYITKQHARSGFYEHLYYCSRGLNTARPIADCYTFDSQLDSCLEFENSFCSCGWLRDCHWSDLLRDGLEPRSFDYFSPVSEVELASETKLSFVQLTIDDWCVWGGTS